MMNFILYIHVVFAGLLVAIVIVRDSADSRREAARRRFNDEVHSALYPNNRS